MSAERGGPSPEEMGINPKEMQVPEDSSQESREVLVGATINPDGSIDKSQAMSWKITGERLEKMKATEEQAKRTRAERLKIPEGVEPGSSEMVWHTLDKAKFLNEEARSKALRNLSGEYKRNAENSPAEKRSEALIKRLGTEMSMMRGMHNPFIQDRLNKTRSEIEASGKKFSANDMLDFIQREFVDNWQKRQSEGDETIMMREGHFDVSYKTTELLEAARDLQGKLIDEATRGEAQ
ncbi:MAG: hypothetical protein V1907_00890 [Candidatus Kerfeldbacteria bacterium]